MIKIIKIINKNKKKWNKISNGSTAESIKCLTHTPFSKIHLPSYLG